MKSRVSKGFIAGFAFLCAAELANADPLPAGARPLTAGELHDMYSGKTQSWRDGPGGWYFSPDRKLTAVAKGTVYGYGRWWITKSGRVCVRATWRWAKGSDGRSIERSCWAHAKVRGAVWKEYDGEWWKWTGKESASFSKGYTYQEQVNALHKRYRS
jgi:hypothetical protein